MCGIAGIVSENPDIRSYVSEMILVQKHRGPDASGIYTDGKVTLGHARLRIIDLSEKADQPMKYDEAVIIYNGEVYNFVELKKDFQNLKTSSDTEVILRLYRKYGINMLEKMNGMFAFAIYDKREGKIILVRDRVGLKPLVYFFDSNLFAFASEIKALLKIPYIAQRVEIDLNSLYIYLSLGYIPSPRTIFTNIHKLEPAHYIIYDTKSGAPKKRRYWKPLRNSCQGNLKKLLRETFQNAVKIRLVSDVPVGVLLSGGIDSSLVALTMSKYTDVKAVTVGYDISYFDERKWAELVAKRCGAEHHVVVLTEDEMLKDVRKILKGIDEPFGDSSFIPSYKACEILKEFVKVALSGDGGDELFGGYTKYKAYLFEGFFPRFSLRMLKKLADMLPEGKEMKLLDFMRKVKKFLRVVGMEPARRELELDIGFGSRAMEVLLEDTKAKVNKELPEKIYRDLIPKFEDLNDIMFCDFQLSLPNDMLFKVDLSSMLNSVEIRSPFLDYRISLLAFSIPPSQKVSLFDSKLILKEIFSDTLPREIRRLPKRGFSIPLSKWLRGKLREDVIDTISSEFFNMREVEKALKNPTMDYEIWTLYAFSVWKENYLR